MLKSERFLGRRSIFSGTSVAVGIRPSATIALMPGNPESEREGPNAGEISRSSTVASVAEPESRGTTDLKARPLRPGPAARRLLAEEQRAAKALLRHLPETYNVIHRVRVHGWSTLRYLMQTEVHTYAFSVAANYLLSTFPFFVLLLTLARRVFHSPAMYNVILQVLRDYLPSNKDFVIRIMQSLANVKGRGQLLSLVMLLISTTGIFLPLEVALNSIWGFKKNRSYLMNLIVGFGLAVGWGSLSVLSVAATVGNLRVLGLAMEDQSIVFRGLSFIVMKVFALGAVISVFFLIYWLLPNGKVPARAVLPAAIMTGLLVEAAKYIYMLALPSLDFTEAYGPFSVSVTLLVWGFWIGLLLLGGAYFSAAEHADRAQVRREMAAVAKP